MKIYVERKLNFSCLKYPASRVLDENLGKISSFLTILVSWLFCKNLSNFSFTRDRTCQRKVSLAKLPSPSYCNIVKRFPEMFPNLFHRSSHQRCSIKKSVLRNFAKLRGKQVPKSLF